MKKSPLILKEKTSGSVCPIPISKPYKRQIFWLDMIMMKLNINMCHSLITWSHIFNYFSADNGPLLLKFGRMMPDIAGLLNTTKLNTFEQYCSTEPAENQPQDVLFLPSQPSFFSHLFSPDLVHCGMCFDNQPIWLPFPMKTNEIQEKWTCHKMRQTMTIRVVHKKIRQDSGFIIMSCH